MSTSAVEFPTVAPQIDTAERERRIAAVESVTGHLRMEGLYASPLAVALQQRYIDGEMTLAEMRNELIAHHSR